MSVEVSSEQTGGLYAERPTVQPQGLGAYLLDVTSQRASFADLHQPQLLPLFEHVGDMVEVPCPDLPRHYDGYNPSQQVNARVRTDDAAPTPVMYVRVERRQSPYQAVAEPRRADATGRLVRIEGLQPLPYEDTRAAVLRDGRIVVYGVRVEWDPHDPSRALRFYTEFRVGHTLAEIHDDSSVFGRSPDGHKDSVLIVRDDGTLGLYTRPQHMADHGGLAYVDLDSIDDLGGDATETYKGAHLIGSHGVFKLGTWGGINDARQWNDEWDILAYHVAKRVPAEESDTFGLRVYRGGIMFRNRKTGQVLMARPHAFAEDAPRRDQYKSPELEFVAFPSSMDLGTKDGAMMMTYGLRDALIARGLLRSREDVDAVLASHSQTAEQLAA